MRSACAQGEELETAYGVMRDGLAALTNLKNILHSPRIGWKPLAQAIEDMRPVSQSIRGAFDLLIADLSVRTNAPSCVNELSSFTTERLVLLDGELDSASAAGMRAKTRLRLESEVVRLEHELSAARELVELLSQAANPCLVELDPQALLLGVLDSLSPRDNERTIPLSVTNTASEIPGVSGNPHTLIPLLSLAVQMLADAGAAHVHATIRSSERMGLLFSMSSAPPPSPAATTIRCAVHPVIQLSAEIARVAGSVSGATFTFSPQPPRVVLQIPRGQESEVVLRSTSVKTPARRL